MFRKLFIAVIAICFFNTIAAQDAGYTEPPADIKAMVLAKPTPGVSIDEKGQWMLFLQRDSYESVEELAKPELRIAGLRINPENFTRSRQSFVTELSLKHIASGKEYTISGLPENLRATNISWSPDDAQIAFVQVNQTEADLYIITVASQQARKVNTSPLNLVMGGVNWFDNTTLLYGTTLQAASAAPARPRMPMGPAVQENYGKASPRPTYQDMIKTPYDETLFAFYTTSQLVKNTNGVETKIGEPAIYSGISVSPDRRYLMIRTIRKPFSYLVPAFGFPTTVSITDLQGNVVKEIASLPSSETAPSGNDNVQNVPRSFEWRDDEAATLVWCEPLDSGLIRNSMEYHDAVYALTAPFTAQPKLLFKTKTRYRGTTWGNNTVALVSEGLRGKQSATLNLYNPSTGELTELSTRNTTDAYTSPGSPVTKPNQYGKNTLLLTGKGKKLLFNNTSGSSPKGDLPFLISFDLSSRKSDTIFKSREGSYEYVVQVLDPENLTLITRRESATEMPNYWLKNFRKRIADQQLTSFTNPYPQLEGISKEKIKYQREDGVTLTGDLYLPKGYDAKRDGPLPVFIWAYPREFNSAADAAQIRGSEHRFTLLNWGSPVFYVTQGYAVLNNAEMPIVATDSAKKPNDNFVDQLKMNAEAAINILSEMGVGDKNRMAVGGHSYGAFMTANLLAHTNLFKAGIARSGAYNRTLTPFGFQNEDRTYWEAPELYNAMSPFSNAHKIKTPILLIHGDMDNNTGTYPIQSERMFNAIKGHGGTARYISLPYESHGYAGRENILHTLAEQFNWLEKYVKNPKQSGESNKKTF